MHCNASNSRGKSPHLRQARPSPEQPGTLGEQLRCLAVYLRLPGYYRRIDPADAWEFSRRIVLPHAAPQRAAA